MDISATIKAIRLMSLEDRIQLVQTIWDDIALERSEKADMTEAQKRELDRRLASYDAALDQVVPWEQAKEQAEARLQK